MVGTSLSKTQEYPDLSASVLAEPRFVKSFLGSASFSYGIYCIGACLCMKFQKPVARSLLVSIPGGLSCFGFMYSHERKSNC